MEAFKQKGWYLAFTDMKYWQDNFLHSSPRYMLWFNLFVFVLVAMSVELNKREWEFNDRKLEIKTRLIFWLKRWLKKSLAIVHIFWMPFCGVWYIVVNNNLKNKVEKTWVFFPFKFVYSLRSDVSYFLSRTRAGIIRPVQSFFPQLMTDRSAKVAPTVFHP